MGLTRGMTFASKNLLNIYDIYVVTPSRELPLVFYLIDYLLNTKAEKRKRYTKTRMRLKLCIMSYLRKGSLTERCLISKVDSLF